MFSTLTVSLRHVAVNPTNLMMEKVDGYALFRRK